MCLSTSLKKGKNNIEMIILSILKDGDFYGYQLTQLVNDYSQKLIEVPEGSLYPALYRLVDNHHVSQYKMKVKVRQERVYYHLEPAGQKYYQELLDEYTRLNTGIQNILNRPPLEEKSYNRPLST